MTKDGQAKKAAAAAAARKATKKKDAQPRKMYLLVSAVEILVEEVDESKLQEVLKEKAASFNMSLQRMVQLGIVKVCTAKPIELEMEEPRLKIQ